MCWKRLLAAVFFLLLLRCPLPAQAPAQDPLHPILSQAYEDLRRKEYDRAVEKFRRVLEMDPTRIMLYRELGYALVKMGETEKAIEAFEAYGRSKPDDFHNILELGYLYYQTKNPEKALELFGRARQAPDQKLAAQAQQAYQAAEQPMLADIARWSKALEATPANDDAREALAEAYTRHGDTQKAIEQFRQLRRQAPLRVRHLVILARLWEKSGNRELANAYHLLASRSQEPRVAEMGLAGLGNRYPFAAEFEKALELEPDQQQVRRELGYLYIQVKQPEAAVAHFERVIKNEPKDYQSLAQLGFLYADLGRRAEAVRAFEQVRREAPAELAEKAAVALERLGARPAASPAPAPSPPPPVKPADDDLKTRIHQHKQMGYASIQKSYLEAAAQEFEQVHRLDPNDYQAIMQLGYIYNSMKKDEVAIKWFRLARSSPDEKVAAEARRAVRNLSAPFKKVITTVWAMPLASSRWETIFGYGQMKTEYRIKSLPFRPYLSVRFTGDARTTTGGPLPQILSDDGIVVGVGAVGRVYKNLWAWGEAGNAVSFLNNRPRGIQRSEPDYRGGLAFYRVWGPTLFQNEARRFVDLTFDAVYLSRFQHNAVFYTQSKTGYQLPAYRGFHHQPFVAVNVAADARGDYFSNFVEFGPGYRFGFDKLKHLHAYVAFLRGVYTTQGRRLRNTVRGPNFTEFRLVVWYSRSF